MRRLPLALALALAVGAVTVVHAAEPRKVKVGILKLTSSAPMFVGVEVAAIFYSPRFAQDRDRAVAFMKGYVRSSRYYFDAVLARRDGKPAHGPHYDEVVAITAKYTEATPEIIRVGFPFQDRDARLDVQDIGRQLAWYHRTGMTTRPLSPRDLVDASFVEEALRTTAP